MTAIVESLSAGDLLLWLFFLAAFFVGMSKGGLPGVGALSVPILSLSISPLAAAAILLPIYIMSDVAGVWLYRREFSLRNIKILIPAGIAGVIVGWLTAAIVSDNVVSILVGITGIGFCLNTWLKPASKRKRTTAAVVPGMFWGTLSGFTSFVSHAGAPPYQVYVLPQQLPKNVFAGTTTIVFAVINLAKVIPYAALQTYTLPVFMFCALLLPVALVGTFLGKLFTQMLPEKWFFLAVQIVLFIISIRLVTKGLS